jgi:phosphoserine aminotransferase
MLGFVTSAWCAAPSTFVGTRVLAASPLTAAAVRAQPAPAAMTVARGRTAPVTKPASPCFSSGPCKKRPGYKLADALADAPLGRSHRSAVGKAKIEKALALTKEILQIPDGYRVAIVPGSDTGAVEMAMWSLLGARPVDVCHWESFGKGWLTDAVSHLALDKYGELPDLSATDKDHDIVFTWNGTTSGVRVPDGADWIADDRAGLTICDATSAVFAMRIPWSKIDVLTYSWQKVLGGEAAHGMLVLSPRAVERLESFTPNRPLPKVFRMTKGGKLDEALFEGAVINTVSMLCVEDYLDALTWCADIGGLDSLVARSEANLAVVDAFVQRNNWAHFLAADPASRSSTSVCLYFDMEKAQVKAMETMLAAESVAFDINSYRDAPAGLRIWCGATVEEDDLRHLMLWIEYCHATITAA